MTSHGTPPLPQGLIVSIHLLESTKGHSVRSWKFHDRAELKIGRLEDNDVVVTDPAVSRLHATLRFEGGAWSMQSVGKHGVLIGDERIETTRVQSQTVFRLGVNGPTLMFECDEAADESSQNSTSTLEFDTFAVGGLNVDRESAAEQVRKITDDQGFKRLLEQAAELRKRRTDSQG